MKKYAVAVCSLFNGVNVLNIVEAESSEGAQIEALKNSGWECTSVSDFKAIEDMVSNAVEVSVSGL